MARIPALGVWERVGGGGGGGVSWSRLWCIQQGCSTHSSATAISPDKDIR